MFEIGSSEGVDFIATEFIDGIDLNRSMSERRLSVDEAVDIAIQAASALRAAHEAGIVHRDIKSDNVMVRNDGIVKVLDFGLAKLTQKSESTSPDLEGETIAKVQTQPGIVMGTPNYMSPEQVRGKGVDHRTDIFSLGVLLYEMLSQVRPFEGETTSDVMAAVLTRSPRLLSEIDRNLPAELEEIVFRALEKDKEKRYSTAEDLLADLSELKQELQIRKRLETTETPGREQTKVFDQRPTVETGSFSSVAVLPFTNMSADEENEFFCDGLAEELLGTLAKIGELKVAARSTSFAFKGSGKSAKEIGESLGVQTILDGSVRKAGNRVRITVQLVDAANGYQLWSDRFDREMKDIFEVQDEIALSVADALKVQLLGEEREAVLKRYTNNAEAYQLYLRGRFFFFKRTPEGFRKAIEYFERAIEIDPEYAIAYSGLADCWVFLGFYEAISPLEAEKNLTPLVKKALELDSGLAETRVSSALKMTLYDWDFKGAFGEYKAALAIDDRYAFGHHLDSATLVLAGLGDEAIAAESRAAELEPFTAIFSASLGWWFYLNDRTDEAIDQALRTVEIAPNHFFAHWVLGLCYAHKGQYAEAVASLSAARSMTDGNQHIVADLARVYATMGKREEALRIRAEMETTARTNYVSAANLARVYFGFGDREKFLESLENAVEERSVKLPWLLIDPMLEDFWSDPQFRAIAAKVGVKRCYSASIDTARSLEAPTVVMRSDTSETSEEPPAAGTRSFPFTWVLASIVAALIAIAAIYFGYAYIASNDRVIDSIAVMPFTNEDGDPDTEYLSDGLTDSLIYRLSQLPDLKVSPTSSVMRYKGKETDVARVASELDVKAVMSGRLVQRSGDLTISLQLIDAGTQKVIWAEQYDRKMSELMATQREIATVITQKLRLKLAGDEKGITKKYTDSNEAYQLYLRGRYYFAHRTKDDFIRSIRYYEEAIKVDPNFALAYARIAEAYDQISGYAYMSPHDSFPKAMAAARKALEIDPMLAEGHTFLAQALAQYDWNWTEAEREFRKGIELDPTSVSARFRYGQFYLSPVGRNSEAIIEIRRAIQSEPFNVNMNGYLSNVYLFDHQYEKALEQARKAHELDPKFVPSRFTLGCALIANGRFDEASRLSEGWLKEMPNEQFILATAGTAYAKAGRRSDAETILARLRLIEQDDYVAPYWSATIYASLGDKEKAFKELERSFEVRDWWLFRLKVDPMFEPLHGDPRFQGMVKRLNFPE